MNKLICPQCGLDDHPSGARFCCVCGQAFSQEISPSDLFVMANAISTYGDLHQQLVAIEEMAELIKEICKHYRGASNRAHIIEETADVEVVTQQIKMIYKDEGEVDIVKRQKIERLWLRILETRRKRQQA